MKNEANEQNAWSEADIAARADHIFQAGYQARRTAVRQALRTPACWAEQSVVCVVGAIRAACFFLLIKGAALVALWAAAGIGDAQEGLLNSLVLLIVVPVVAFNPRRWFLRNVFSIQGDRAFDDALRQLRQDG
ncbi:hypothetical protein [Pseudomonas sp. PS02302]|jgi:hypothetical protein|uniref:hypothetical protein n=1 Tax=Pseudomonas sp. PS02302 TaxID=2991428 RepID=UPI00249C5737|nr:hypothetical protein [Pseudomonas sp. PS02302]